MFCTRLLSQGARMTQSACIVTKLSLEFSSKTLFKNLQLSLAKQQLSACIGRNGLGKSLILQILHFQSVHEIPYEGEISWQMPHAYLSQFSRLQANTIADALGVDLLYQAFKRVESGIGHFEDFELTEHQWHLPLLWQQHLLKANLPTQLDFPISSLSEGQKTKLALCALFLKTDHYLLLDEPSNHLDHASRLWLIDCLKAHPSGALIVSHDRALLQHVAHIYALNEHGITSFSGNYTDYIQQFNLQNLALERSVLQQKRDLNQLKRQQHEIKVKTQKREQQGQQLRCSKSQAKVLLDFKKEQAGQSLSTIQTQQKRQLEEKKSQLLHTQQQLEQFKNQQFYLNHHARKSGEILRVNHFQLPQTRHKPIHFGLKSGEKIHLRGSNGIGKSTFLTVLNQYDVQKCSDIYLCVTTLYLDQNFSQLKPELSVLDNLAKFNPEISSTEWRNQLGQLRIRGDKSELIIQCLSGGERLKVALLGLSFYPENIELLLLDEPENHLDIESRELLANAIKHYSGAVILVSHDAEFVQACGIQNYVEIEDLKA